jgi:hypothetical protein
MVILSGISKSVCTADAIQLVTVLTRRATSKGLFMIQSFKCKETAKIFEAGFSRKFSAGILKSAIIRLAMLNRSGKLDDLKVPPSNHLKTIRR